MEINTIIEGEVMYTYVQRELTLSVGHGVMVLALMSKKANMINVGHGIMVLALMSRRSIWYCHYMSVRS
jgi:hypothetical protein